MKRMIMLLAAMWAAVIVAGCTTDGLIDAGKAGYSAYTNATGTAEVLTPKVNETDNTQDAAWTDPVIPSHGQEFEAVTSGGKRFRMWPDGYFIDWNGPIAPFELACDQYSIAGLSKRLELNGGRSFLTFPMLGSIVKPLEKGIWGHPDYVNKTEWHTWYKGGIEVVYVYSHGGDVLSGVHVIDHVRGKTADFNAQESNGKGEGPNNKRVPGYIILDGVRYNVGVRFPWNRDTDLNNQPYVPIRSATYRGAQ